MDEVLSDIIEMVRLSEGLFQNESYEINLLREFLKQFLIVHLDYSSDPNSKWNHIRFQLQHLNFQCHSKLKLR